MDLLWTLISGDTRLLFRLNASVLLSRLLVYELMLKYCKWVHPD